MSKVSSILRKVERGYAHWCEACEEIHILPETGNWVFVNKDMEKPTFTPSFKHEGEQIVKVNGKWNGKWVRDTNGNTVPFICHYTITDGKLNYCDDSTHSLKGQVVDIPKLPEGLIDD